MLKGKDLRNAVVGFCLGTLGLYALAVTIPNTFSNGTTISSNAVNANFAALGNAVTALETKVAALEANGSITNNRIADGAVTGQKIAPNTITASNVLDEPGIAANRVLQSSIITATSGMADVLSVSITIPAAGQIIVDFTSQAGVAGSAGSQCVIFFQVDETPGAPLDPNNNYAAGSDNLPNTGRLYIPAIARRIFTKSNAGTYTFRVGARKSAGAGCVDLDLYNARLTAMYVPTTYGTVSTSLVGPVSVPTR